MKNGFLGRLAHLNPLEADRYLKPLWNPERARRAPIENLAKLCGVEFEMIDDRKWPYSTRTWGKTFYDESDVPTRVVIRVGGDVPLNRSRFTIGHELGHLVFGNRPTGNGLDRSLNRGFVKDLYRKGVGTPLRWQDVVGNELADLFAEAALVDEDRLRLDLRSHHLNLQNLCRMYGVSGWVMACSVVRVLPEPSIAIAFSAKGPLPCFRANNAALWRSGLYDWALTQFCERRSTQQWKNVAHALKTEQETSETFELGGFALKAIYFPATKFPWFFRYRNDEVKLIALFRQDHKKAIVHRVPGTPLSSGRENGELVCLLGPYGTKKSQQWRSLLEKERCHLSEMRCFRFFGVRDDDDGAVVRPLWDRTGVAVLEHVGPKVRIVAFDEAHFARPEFIHVIELLLSQGKKVVIAAADLDFRGDPWPFIEKLLPIAHAVNSAGIIYSKSKCQSPEGCRQTAKYSQLVGKYPDDIYHVITDRDSLHPVCPSHFTQHPIPLNSWGKQLAFDV